MRSIPRRELALVGAAMALGLAIRLAYVLATQDHRLAGDEYEYDLQGRFIEAGRWFWSTTPYGIAHASIWKPPGYVAWVGSLYSIFGPDRVAVYVVQAFLGPIVIALTWLLGRRLFAPKAGLAAAFVVAVHPFAWQYEVRLFSESIATPLTLLVLIAILGTRPSPPRAVGVGVLMGVLMLVRPAGIYLFAGIAAAWWIAAGWRRGLALTAACLAVAALVVAPWTYRNHHVFGSFVPISIQDGSQLYGSFNDDAAHDSKLPYAWRPVTTRDRALFEQRNAMPDDELRRKLIDRSVDYTKDHPDVLYKAFFWNGLSRFWDVRRPSNVLGEVAVQGRSRTLTKVGLAIYWVLLPLSLYGLWRFRARPELVVPILAIALFASIVNTPNSTTRYRAVLEPLIAVLAAGAVLGRAPARP